MTLGCSDVVALGAIAFGAGILAGVVLEFVRVRFARWRNRNAEVPF